MGGLAIQYTKLPETKRNSPLLIQRTKSSQPIKSPADRILFLQRTIGNQAVQRLIKSGTLQTKLKIGQPGDKYEQEADRVADAVMRMPEPGVQRQVEPEEEEEMLQSKPLANQITPLVQVQRQEEPEEEEETLQAKPLAEEITPLVQRQVEPEEEEEELQAKPNSSHISEVNPNLESDIQSLKRGGQPLSENDRAFFEPRFGCDFSRVRVHSDTQAAEAALAVNAQAFTVGQDVVFGTKQFEPGTNEGRKLLAHELTHVVQQNGARQDTEKKLNPLYIHQKSSLAVMREILLKIAKYQGSSTVPDIDVQIADHIYDQCNHLNVSLSAPVIDVNHSNTQSDLRGDTTLDYDSRAEIDAVKTRVNTGPNEIPVAYVDDIIFNSRRGYSGYTLNGLVAVSNRSVQPHILAHEVGHFLGLEHGGHGSRDLMYENPENIGYRQSQPPRLLLSDCRTVRSRIQPKLTVSTTGDMYEQEADRVADQVMRIPQPHRHYLG